MITSKLGKESIANLRAVLLSAIHTLATKAMLESESYVSFDNAPYVGQGEFPSDLVEGINTEGFPIFRDGFVDDPQEVGESRKGDWNDVSVDSLCDVLGALEGGQFFC